MFSIAADAWLVRDELREAFEAIRRREKIEAPEFKPGTFVPRDLGLRVVSQDGLE
jgi:hypothetical protein